MSNHQSQELESNEDRFEFLATLAKAWGGTEPWKSWWIRGIIPWPWFRLVKYHNFILYVYRDFTETKSRGWLNMQIFLGLLIPNNGMCKGVWTIHYCIWQILVWATGYTCLVVWSIAIYSLHGKCVYDVFTCWFLPHIFFLCVCVFARSNTTCEANP